MLRFLLMLVVAVVADEITPYNATGADAATDHDTLTLQDGCTSADGIGSVIVECSITGTRFSYQVDMAVTSVNVIYETDSQMICADLLQAKPLVDSYISTDGQTDVHLNFLKIESVVLSNESLTCPLTMLGANKTDVLRISKSRGNLLPHHLEGIQGVLRFQMFQIEKNITSVPYTALSRLTSLEKVTLTGGSFVLQEEGADNLLPKLKTLELSQGGLKTLPKRAFTNTPALTLLLLFANQIEHVDVDAFEGLTKLEQLSITSNRITTLPVGVFRYSPNMMNIDLYNNEFTNLTEGVFSGLTRLKKVSLFNNQAKLTLSGGVFAHLPALSYLKLETASLSTLPPDLILNTPTLQTLIMKNNFLKTLPPILFSSSASPKSTLDFIDLSVNGLVTLHKLQFANLVSLKTLILDNNLLANFSVGVFANLTDLEVLMLKNNRIEILAKGIFKGLNNLRQLHLDGNKIKIIQPGAFDVVLTLQILSLSDNNLTISKTINTERVVEFVSYESGTGGDDSHFMYFSRFRTLQSLKELHLAGNRVSVMCNDWQDLYQLDKLDLARNNFTKLTVQDTYFVSNATVNLSDNNIETVDVYEHNSTIPLDQRPTLLLHGNPFRCTCELYSFLSAYLEPASAAAPRFALGHAACAAPPDLRGARLTALRPDRLTCAALCPPPCRDCRRRPAARHLEATCDVAPAALPVPPAPLSYALRLTSAAAVAALRLDLPALALAHLDLSNLSLAAPPPAPPPGAATFFLTLDLRHNSLDAVPAALLEAGAALYLAGNPLECTCARRASLQAAARHAGAVLDYAVARCEGGRALAAAARAATAGELCQRRDALLAAAALAVAPLLALALGALLYARRTRLLVLCRKYLPRRLVAELGGAHMYDVFLSYAHADEQWVRVALPVLEGGGLRLCVHSRDWRLGDAIAEQAARSVREAALTLALVSPAYLASAWCALEFRLAHARGRLLVLVLDEAALAGPALAAHALLREYVRANTYVRANHPRVWDKVHEAVRRRSALPPGPPPPTDADKPRGLHAALTDDGKIVNAALHV